MGAYLIYKCEARVARKVNKFLDGQEEQKKLQKFRRGVWFWDQDDRKFELKKLKETGAGAPDFQKIGEGEWKASGFEEKEEVCYGLVVKLFKKLHEAFTIWVYSGSCALSTDYFSVEDIRIITKNGERLTGDYKEEILNILKIPEVLKSEINAGTRTI